MAKAKKTIDREGAKLRKSGPDWHRLIAEVMYCDQVCPHQAMWLIIMTYAGTLADHDAKQVSRLLLELSKDIGGSHARKKK